MAVLSYIHPADYGLEIIITTTIVTISLHSQNCPYQPPLLLDMLMITSTISQLSFWYMNVTVIIIATLMEFALNTASAMHQSCNACMGSPVKAWDTAFHL